jgi:hypothetical protein
MSVKDEVGERMREKKRGREEVEIMRFPLCPLSSTNLVVAKRRENGERGKKAKKKGDWWQKERR